MARNRYAGFFSHSSKMGLLFYTGNLFFNHIFDAFFIFAFVAAARMLALEAYHCLSKGSISKERFKPLFKKMCKEGAYWGAIAGMYVAFQYGMEITLAAGDWKSATLGGMLTGALVSLACNHNRDKVVEDAITGGAIATAAEFLQYLT